MATGQSEPVPGQVDRAHYRRSTDAWGAAGTSGRKERILVVDDERNMAWLFRESLGTTYDVQAVLSGEEALSVLEAEPADIVMLDLKLPGADGIEVLKEVKRRWPEIPVIMMTAYATVRTAVLAVKAGAYDYIMKPFDMEEVKMLIENALTYSRLDRQADASRLGIQGESPFGDIVSTSAAMRTVFEDMERAAPTDASILVQGESGTGKELIARAIHRASRRRGRAFVPINCAALPENLLESELFGYQKGAFTGAWRDKPGKFELADGGTLFLDEVGDMALGLQGKLLRAIEERVIEPLGGTKRVPLDVRIIAATNVDLRERVVRGLFRRDLFYRLAVIPIYVPPLRERREDIPVLARHFLKIFASKYGKDFAGFAPDCMEVLYQYDWPGNVRELQNLVEQLVVLREGGIIRVSDLPRHVLTSGDSCRARLTPRAGAEGGMRELREVRKAAERDAIIYALKKFHGNRTRAAKYLGISRRAIQLKIKSLQLPFDEDTPS